MTENEEIQVENFEKMDAAKSVKKCPIVCCVPTLIKEVELCFNTLCKYALWQEEYTEIVHNFKIGQKEEVLYIETPAEVYEIGNVSEIELFAYHNQEKDIHNIACGINGRTYLLQFQVNTGQVDFLDMFEWKWREVLI